MAPPRSARPVKVISLRMSPEEKRYIAKRAKRDRTTQTDIIRGLIRSEAQAEAAAARQPEQG